MSESEDGVAFWLIILLVVLIIFVILCCCTCFVVRCFAPENTKGPSWEHNTEGRRWIRPVTWHKKWLAYETDECPDILESEDNCKAQQRKPAA